MPAVADVAGAAPGPVGEILAPTPQDERVREIAGPYRILVLECHVPDARGQRTGKVHANPCSPCGRWRAGAENAGATSFRTCVGPLTGLPAPRTRGRNR